MAVIQDVDEVLRKLLAEELAQVPGSLVKGDAQIVFGLPDANPKADLPRVSLYLHDIRENRQQRDETFHVVRNPGEGLAVKFRGPVRVDLSYVLAVDPGADPAAEHKILSDCLTVLYRNPVVPDKFLTDALRQEGAYSLVLSVAQSDHPAHGDAPGLWRALSERLRPTIAVVATATFNPYETRQVRLVREAIVALGQGARPAGPDRQMSLTSLRVSVAGIASDRDTGRPIADVAVRIADREEHATTDDSGLFFIANLPPGKCKVVFTKRGYEEMQLDATAPPPGRSDLLEPLDVRLAPQADPARARSEQGALGPDIRETDRLATVSLVGRLRYPDGRPAAYIPVSAGAKMAVTDGDGVYHFTGLASVHTPVTATVAGFGEVPVKTSEGAATLALDDTTPAKKPK